MFSDASKSWLLRTYFLDWRKDCGLRVNMPPVVYVMLLGKAQVLLAGDNREYLETIKETLNKSLFKAIRLRVEVRENYVRDNLQV